MAFGIGDKVKVIRSFAPAVPDGATGTIESISENGLYFRTDLGDVGMVPLLEAEIELIQPKPAFNIGDKIRLLDNRNPIRVYAKVGAVGTVMGVDEPTGDWNLFVKFNSADNDDPWRGFDEGVTFEQTVSFSAIELVEQVIDAELVDDDADLMAKLVGEFADTMAAVVEPDPREIASVLEEIAEFMYDAADLEDRKVEIQERAAKVGIIF